MMWRKWLLLAGLAATFGGIALRMQKSSSAESQPHEHAADGGMAGMKHGMATGDGTPGIVNGLELKLLSTPAAGDASPITFKIMNGATTITGFSETHTKLLHFIAVNKDLSGYQHIHPTLAPDGTWSTTAKLTPGTWRFIADSLPVIPGSMSMQMTLATDAVIPGEATAAPPLVLGRTTSVDGYSVTASGEIGVGHAHNFTLSIAKDGKPVTDVGEYLGAYGHLVALDTKTLTYTHLHPGREAAPGVLAGPDVVFQAQLPKASIYKLFFEFNAGGSVHKAELALDIYE
jgi:hypothetical protein